ncbi:Fc.00g070040.m01.CDS01 [Cosmosporella sp. VM-42]
MLASHGRGGAGNMADSAQTPKPTPHDLQTPTLKTAVVTTGRGGTGNMAKNKDPYETRLRQDVEAVTRRSSSGAQHAGRGGAGNVFKDDEASLKLTLKTSNENAVDDGPVTTNESLATKGKNWLFGKKA